MVDVLIVGAKLYVLTTVTAGLILGVLVIRDQIRGR